MFLFVLPSGLNNPVASMPDRAQRITCLLLTIDLMRAVYLPGMTFRRTFDSYTVLSAFAALFNLRAPFSHRKQA